MHSKTRSLLKLCFFAHFQLTANQVFSTSHYIFSSYEAASPPAPPPNFKAHWSKSLPTPATVTEFRTEHKRSEGSEVKLAHVFDKAPGGVGRNWKEGYLQRRWSSGGYYNEDATEQSEHNAAARTACERLCDVTKTEGGEKKQKPEPSPP